VASATVDESPGPGRDRAALGFWPAAALVVGHTIGIGIFLTPAEIIGALASPAWTLAVWSAVGALVLCGALTFGELAARRPRAGGLYAYLREAWGPRVAELYGWQCVLVTDPGIAAALAAGLAGYASILGARDAAPASGDTRWIAAAAVWILALPALAGFRTGTRTAAALTALKLVSVLGFALLAFAGGHGSWDRVLAGGPRPAGSPPLSRAVGLAVVGAFYSFGGFWEVARLGDRMRDPRRTLARALTAGAAAVTLAYVATTAAFLYVVPASEARDPVSFARRAGEAVLGPKGPIVLAAVVVLSAGVSVASLFVMAPRMYAAMAADGALPAFLGAERTRRGTLLLATLSTALVLAGSFRQIVFFFLGTTVVFVAAAAAALFVLRRREPESPGFRAPGYPLVPALFLALLLAVVVLVVLAQPVPVLAGAAAVLAAAAIRTLGRRSGTVSR